MSRFPTVLLVLALTLAGAARAAAQCNYLTLASGVAQSSSASPANLRFVPVAGHFAAVGARSAAGSDHGLSLYGATAAFPACMSGLLTTSATPAGRVEVAVGDYRPGHNAIGARLGQAVRSAGGGDATFEWEDSATELVQGEPPDSVHPAPPVLDAYQAFLEGGNTYTLNLTRSGSADLRLLVFRNPGAGTFWEARGGANMLLDVGQRTVFTAPASDDYALVVVNDNGLIGGYELWVEICQDPDTLLSGVSRPNAYPDRLLFDAEDPYWQAVGIRSEPGANWNVAVYDTGRGSSEPTCFAGLLAQSARTSGVDFVVADLSSGPLKPFYVREILAGDTGGARIEWDAGADEIEVNGVPILRATDANDVLETWDVAFVPGTSYTIDFNPSGASLRWFLFENVNQGPGGAAWFARDQAILSGTSDGGYTATSEGWHGLVIVNENGGTGSYTLSVLAAAAVDAGPPGAPRTALGSITPNPVRGRAAIGFTLAHAARVRIEVVDVAGRRVARLDGGDQPAGAGALAWDGRAAGGLRLDAGVYFARLFVDDRAIGAARMVVLR